MDSRHYLANYEIEKEIGQGSFATVYLGHEKVKKKNLFTCICLNFSFKLKHISPLQTTKLKVAIKAVNTAKLNKKLAENLASEITILKEIDHPNIIKLYEIQVNLNPTCTKLDIYIILYFILRKPSITSIW